MMLICLFLLFMPIYTYTSANIGAQGFEKMREHFKDCQIECTNPACANKKIPSDTYKKVYKDLFCAYHCIKEFASDENMRFFMNHFGQIVACKKDAQFKSELVLCVPVDRYGYYKVDEYANISQSNSHNIKLSDLDAPTFTIVQDQHNKMHFEECNMLNPRKGSVWTDMICCNLTIPTEILQIIVGYVDGINSTKKQYVCSFFDTYQASDKRYLFRLVSLSKVQKIMKKYFERNNDVSKKHACFFYGKDILVDDTFNISTLHRDVDIYGNGGRRIVMICEHHNNKSFSLIHMAHKSEDHPHFQEKDRGLFFVQHYTMKQVNENHSALMHGNIGSSEDTKYPFNCYCPQRLTGSEKALKDYLAAALQRAEIATSLLCKNEAATTDDCEVFNNPFGEFVVFKENKPTVVIRYVGLAHIYNHVYDNAELYDKDKMMKRAQGYAQPWKKTDDGRFIYYSEDKPQPICAKVWPYGVKLTWEGMKHLKLEGYKDGLSILSMSKKLTEFGEDHAPFSRYRFWIFPLQQKNQGAEMSVFHTENNRIDGCVFFTDHPYRIVQTDGYILSLEHSASNYNLFASLYYNNTVESDFECWQGYPGVHDGSSSVSLAYVYKNQEKHQQCQNRKPKPKSEEELKKEREQAKIQEMIDMGFLPDPSAQNQPVDEITEEKKTELIADVASRTQKNDSGTVTQTTNAPSAIRPSFLSFLAPLRQPVTMFIGGIALGAVLGGLHSLWHKQTAVDAKLPAPTV